MAESIGHNGPDDALILEYARGIIALDERIEEVTDERKSLVGEVRSRYKSAKKAGIHIGALQPANDNTRRDPEDVKVEEQNYIRIANLFQMPMSQGDLFPADAVPPMDPNSPEGQRQAIFDAGLQGLRAGKAGWKIEDCPFDPDQDTDEHKAWISNWHAGQAHLARGLTPPKAAGRRSNKENPEDRPEA